MIPDFGKLLLSLQSSKVLDSFWYPQNLMPSVSLALDSTDFQGLLDNITYNQLVVFAK